MPVFCRDGIQDVKLNEIAKSTQLSLCEGAPADYNEANDLAPAGKALVKVTLGPADFSISDAPSGRQLTIAAKAGQAIGASGTADHWVLTTTAGQTLDYYTESNTLTLVQGRTVDIDPNTINDKDPVIV